MCSSIHVLSCALLGQQSKHTGAQVLAFTRSHVRCWDRKASTRVRRCQRSRALLCAAGTAKQAPCCPRSRALLRAAGAAKQAQGWQRTAVCRTEPENTEQHCSEKCSRRDKAAGGTAGEVTVLNDQIITWNTYSCTTAQREQDDNRRKQCE
jgi:hypothetical protein